MVTRDAFCAGRMGSWIGEQVAFGPRHAGSPAGRRNEAYLLGELQRLGLSRVHPEAIPVAVSEANRTTLTVTTAGHEPRELACFAIPYCAFTDEAGVEAPLVSVDAATPFPWASVRGAIVVCDIRFPALNAGLLTRLGSGVYDPDHSLGEVRHPATWVRLGWHLYRYAARHGAVGFVGILRDQPGGTCRMYAPYGFRESDILDKPLPGVWLGRDDGAWLRGQLRAGRVRARLRGAGRRVAGVTHNLVGFVAGQSDEQIVLSCHHDSPFRSPVEDASGVAVVLALAEHFAAQPLCRTLVVLLTAGHFYGSIGTRSYIRAHREELPRIAAEISIEHIAREACEDAAGRLVPTGRPEATAIFVPFNDSVNRLALAAVRAHDLDRTVLLPAEGPLGDYPPTDGGDWHLTGVPTVNCISNPVYLLTDDDAERFVDEGRLTKMAATFADLIRALDARPLAELRRVDGRLRKLGMTLLRHVLHAKTTCFGLKPLY